MGALPHRRRMRSGCRIFAVALLALPPVQASFGSGRAEETLDPATAALADLQRRYDEGFYQESSDGARTLLAGIAGRGGEPSLLEADVLHLLVNSLINLGRHREAEAGEAARRALEIRTSVCGPACAAVARSEVLLSRLDAAAGEYPSAEAHARRALEIAEALPEPRGPVLAECLERLAFTLWQMARQDEARPLYERALALHEARAPEGTIESTWSLEGLGRIHADAGDLQEALRLFERSLEIEQRLLAADHPLLSRTLNAIAVIHRRLGDNPKAVALYERTLRINEARLGPDHPNTAVALTNLANARWDVGDPDGARGLLERALRIRLQKLGEEHPLTAMNQLKLAGALFELGDHAAASDHFRKANEILVRTRGPEHTDVAAGLYMLGTVSNEMGDFESARIAIERGLQIYRKAHGERSEKAAEGLWRLADVHLQLHEPREAESLLRRALEIQAQPGGLQSFQAAVTSRLLGLALLEEGRLEESGRWTADAVAVLEEVAGPESQVLGLALMQLGRVHMEAGSLEEAEKLARRAASIFEERADLYRGRIESLALLARLRLLRGDPGGSLERALESESAGREAFRAVALVLTESAALRYERLRRSGLDLALSALADSARARPLRGSDVGKAFDALIRSRALVLAEMAERGRFVRLRQRPETSALAEDLRRASLRLSKLVFSGVSDGGGAVAAQHEAARKEKERAELALARQASRLSADAANEEVGLGEVAAALPDGAALVAYVRFNRWTSAGAPSTASGATTASAVPEGAGPPTAPAVQTSAASLHAGGTSATVTGDSDRVRVPAAGEVDDPTPLATSASGGGATSPAPGTAGSRFSEVPSYAAFVLPVGSTEPVLVPLGEAAAVEEAVSSWRRAVSAPGPEFSGAASPSAKEYGRAGSTLRERIWDPVERHVGEARMVFVAPDGPVSLVNLTTLPRADGTYLLERGPLIHYLAAEREIVAGGRTERSGEGLMAVGEPDYDGNLAAVGRGSIVLAAHRKVERKEGTAAAPVYRGRRSSCDDPKKMTFAPLPASGAEIESIAKLWTETGKPGGPSPRGALFLKGLQASEDAFKRLAPGRKVLHVATHGFFLGDDCRAAGGGAAWTRIAESPMLLSGLALAGANHRGEVDPASEQEDGILTAEEIAALDLGGVEWAVLSACDTGVGEVQAGEGVLGLRRAFSTAGARTLIMTLWAVDDAATLDWMKRLYRLRLSGLPTSESVRRASLESLQERKERGRSTHPFFWGGFIAAGDWR